MPNPPQASAIPDPKPPDKEETLILDFMLEFKDELLMNMQIPRITIL
jgi:hypothetical protein